MRVRGEVGCELGEGVGVGVGGRRLVGRVGAGVVMLMGGVERIGASEAGREGGGKRRVDPGG